MKTIKNFFLMALAGSVFTLAACSDDDREPSPIPTDGVQAYIYAEKTELTYLPEDEQAFTLKVARQKIDQAASVHLTTTAEGITLPTSVDFAAGESVKDVKVTFNMAIGTTQDVTISVPEEEGYIYGAQSVTFKLSRDYTWLNIGTGVYTSTVFGQSWEQPIYKAKEANVYKLVDCITEGYPMIFTLSDDNQSLVLWDIQPTGYEHATYGMTYFASEAMQRDGNVLTFTVSFLVEYNGGWGSLGDYVESVEFPEGILSSN